MITHLKARAEFYTLCLEHGEENVEWRSSPSDGGWTRWCVTSSEDPSFSENRTYQFRLRPQTVYIPEAELPEEDPEGAWKLHIATWRVGEGACVGSKYFSYRTAEDRDKVVAAMLARKTR